MKRYAARRPADSLSELEGQRFAPPPDSMDAPLGTTVAYVYLFDAKDQPTTIEAEAERIEWTFWGGEDGAEYIGSRHGFRPRTGTEPQADVPAP